MRHDYTVGDMVWTELTETTYSVPRVRGEIVNKFVLYTNDQTYYVIKLDVAVSDFMQVRSAFEMTDTEDGPIGHVEDVPRASGVPIVARPRRLGALFPNTQEC